MARLCVVALVLAALCGCEGPAGPSYEMDRGKYSTVVYDGCEYIVSTSSTALTHKGNCKNPIHVYNRVETTVHPAQIQGAGAK